MLQARLRWFSHNPRPFGEAVAAATDWDALLAGGLHWLRWFAIGAVLLLAGALFAAGRLGLAPVLAILAVAAYNGVVHAAAGWSSWLRSYRNVTWLDLFVVSGAVYASGDPNCPAQLLYFMAAISGALSMRVRESLLFAGALGLVSAFLTVGARPEPGVASVALDAASERFVLLVVFAGVSSALVRRLLVVRDEAARERLLARRLSLLNELLWQANASYLELDRLMPTIARLVHQALGGHLAVTALRPGKDGEGSTLAWATEGLDDGSIERLARSLVVQDAVGLKDVAVAWDVHSDSRCADPVFAALGIRSCIAAPLCDDEGVFGAILVAAPVPNRFSRTDVELLMAIAAHAALPIRNARLHSLEREHAARLVELETAKRDFLTIASHELRTPLAAVKLGQDVLAARLAAKLGTEDRLLLGNVERNVHRLERLFEDFLLLARLQGGSVQIHCEPVDLGETIRAAVAELRPELERQQQPVSVASDESLVLADRRQLRRVLHCLLSNASKFSPSQTAIAIDVQRRGEQTIVSVVDEGPGIPIEQRERVFLPFVRLSAGSCEGRGAGLGLSIARALVDLHGGRLWIEEGRKGGSAFRFTLPRYSGDEAGR